MGAVAISVEGLWKRFGAKEAVSGIDLAIATGSFAGLVGPNGAGKTTSLSMLTGLLRPDYGRILINGVDVWVDPVAAKALIGVVPAEARLFERLSGEELLEYAGRLRGIPAAEARRRAAQLLDVLDLVPDAKRLVADYSTGSPRPPEDQTAAQRAARLDAGGDLVHPQHGLRGRGRDRRVRRPRGTAVSERRRRGDDGPVHDVRVRLADPAAGALRARQHARSGHARALPAAAAAARRRADRRLRDRRLAPREPRRPARGDGRPRGRRTRGADRAGRGRAPGAFLHRAGPLRHHEPGRAAALAPRQGPSRTADPADLRAV